MSHIVMLLSNPYRPDPRVLWESQALLDAGYRVTLIAWDRQAELPAVQLDGLLEIDRIQNVRSSYGAGIKQAVRIPAFWQSANHLALSLQPDLVHCHDLDTLYAGVQLRRRLGCRLVYDAHENYPALMSLMLPSAAVWLLRGLENLLLRSADHTITASRRFAMELKTRGYSRVTAIGNYADLDSYQKIEPSQLAATRANLGLREDDLVVSYIGGFTQDRVILPLLEAAEMLPEVKFIVAGDGPQRPAIEARIKDRENIHDLGWISLDKVPTITKMSDVIYYALSPRYPGAEYNAPNALGNALAAGRAMLSNDVGDLGDTLRRYNCGLLLDSLAPADIAAGITRLQDPAFRRKLEINALQAAAQGRNARASRQLVVDLYRDILPIDNPDH
jgi:glycosyltransferase involved in cell wall biosynthesis